jgi:hypothetical protein
MKERPTFDKLPLFADEAAVGAALLGPERACEWPDLAPLLERNGFPKIDDVMGGRYTPAIKRYFDAEYGLCDRKPAAVDGRENPDAWNRKPVRLRPV